MPPSGGSWGLPAQPGPYQAQAVFLRHVPRGIQRQLDPSVSVGIVKFVQQSGTENGPAVRFSLFR